MLKMRTLVLMLSVAIAVSLIGGTAFAKGKSKSKTSNKDLSTALQGLEWGLSHAKVLKALEEKVMEEYEAKVKDVKDLGKKDKHRKQATKRYEKIEKSYREFSGKRSGLEVSVVGNEFVAGNGESVIVMRENEATRYYFFVNDELYKVAIAYDSDYLKGVAFDSFVNAVSKKYGKPADEFNDEEGFFIQAEWKDKNGNKLRVEDFSDTFDTFLMAYSDISLESQVAEKHEAHRSARGAEPEVSADIDALTDGGDWQSERSAADAILGGDTAVDLKAGLPEEDLKAMADEEIAKETADKGGTSTKKRKRKKAKKRGKSKFKDVDKKKEKSGIIIY